MAPTPTPTPVTTSPYPTVYASDLGTEYPEDAEESDNAVNTPDDWNDWIIRPIEKQPPSPAPTWYKQGVPTVSSPSYEGYGSSSSSDDQLPPGAIAVLVIVGIFCGAARLVFEINRSEQRNSTNGTTTRPVNPVNGGTTGPSTFPSPNRASTLPSSNRPSSTPQTVDLVRNMTPQERRDYVTNFLRKQKYVEQVEGGTISGSGRYIVSQSKRHVVDSSQREECAICLEEFADGEDICSSQNSHCPHHFHLLCAFEWLQTSQNCPCCRRDYLTIGQKLSSPRVIPPVAPPPSAPLESDLDTSTAPATPNEPEVEVPRETLSRSISFSQYDV